MRDTKDKTFKDYLGDIGLFGVVQLFLPFTGLVTLPLVTKVLGVSDYGIVALGSTTASILLLFVFLSLTSALVRFIPGERDKKIISTAFVSSLLVILFAGMIIILLMLPLSNILAVKIFQDMGAKTYLYIIAFTVLFNAWNTTLFTYFRILEQVKRYLMYQVLFTITSLGLLAAAVLLARSLLFIFLAGLANSMLTFAVLLAIFLREQGWAKPDLKMIKPYLVFCLPLIVPQIMSWTVTLSDRYFISYFRGTTETGIYNAAYNLPQFIIAISAAIWFVFTPVMAKWWNAGAFDEVRKYLGRVLKLFMLFGLPTVFGCIMLGNPVLTILSTAEIGRESWKVIPFVSLSHIAYAISGCYGTVLLLRRKTQWAALLWIPPAVVNIVGNFLLIPRYGILGASIATLLAYLIMVVGFVWVGRRFFIFPIDWYFIAKAVLASLVMAIFLWFFHPIGIWEVIISIFAGAIIYFVALFLMKGFNREEIEFAKGFLIPKRRK